jgi:hypothetical protein
MLKLLSHIPLEAKVIQQRETPRRDDNKVIARRQTRLRAATSANREAGKPQFFLTKFLKKSIDKSSLT